MSGHNERHERHELSLIMAKLIEMEKQMAKFDDQLAQLNGTVASVGTDVVTISGGIDKLIANGNTGLTPQQQADFDAFQTSMNALKTQSDAVVAKLPA